MNPITHSIHHSALEYFRHNANDKVMDIDCTFQIPSHWDFEAKTASSAKPKAGKMLTVSARLVGSDQAPVILVLGGISANRHVCDHSTGGNFQQGWWKGVAGANRALDIQQFRLLSFDFLPESSPQSDLAITITPQDQAFVANAVCELFAIERLHAFVGASYGGMIALSFGALFPDRVDRLIVACASHRPHPMGTAWRSIQRKIVQLGLETQQPEKAIALARELGMTTYRTASEFGERFSCPQETEAYLESRGRDFIGRMSPQRYLSLSQSIDLHQVKPSTVKPPTSLIAFRQDQLVPVADMRLLGQKLPRMSHYFEFDSIYGHDAFLKETTLIGNSIRQALTP